MNKTVRADPKEFVNWSSGWLQISFADWSDRQEDDGFAGQRGTYRLEMVWTGTQKVEVIFF